MLILFIAFLLQNSRLAVACPAENGHKALIATSVLEVRDGNEGDLAPDDEHTLKGSVEQRWDLDAYRKGSSKMLLRCEYRDTKDKLTFEIPPAMHHCTKTFRADADGMPVEAPRMVCN